MKNTYNLVFLLLVSVSCSENIRDNSSIESQETDNGGHEIKYKGINLKYDNPVLLDSSGWVYYALTLEDYEKTDGGFKSKGSGRQSASWNIAFYNVLTKQTHLLSESLRMSIKSIHTESVEVLHSGERKMIKFDHIFYSLTTNDFNQDGDLNSEDPQYLYMSDRAGHGLRQVSPKNFDLVYWKVIPEINKVLIQARNDVNGDLEFDGDDEITPFIYDIKTHKLEQVFADEFKMSTKKVLQSQWINE